MLFTLLICFIINHQAMWLLLHHVDQHTASLAPSHSAASEVLRLAAPSNSASTSVVRSVSSSVNAPMTSRTRIFNSQIKDWLDPLLAGRVPNMIQV